MTAKENSLSVLCVGWQSHRPRWTKSKLFFALICLQNPKCGGRIIR